MRKKTYEYIKNQMRDSGGYHTLHAMWSLIIAYQNQCLPNKEFEYIIPSFQKEVLFRLDEIRYQNSIYFADLKSEQYLMLIKSGYHSKEIFNQVLALSAKQVKNGSFFRKKEKEPFYYLYHANMLMAWSLSEIFNLCSFR